jgi:hypothetical protein
MNGGTSAGDGKTIKLKIRISNAVARTARCSGSALKGLAPWVEHRFE